MSSVVITGASTGIGRDTALHFNHLGYTVFAGVRNLADGEAVRAQATRPEQLHPLQLDVTDDEEVTAAVAAVTEKLGSSSLTTLISNAGIAAMSYPASCEECPIETQQRIMDVNFFGAVRVVRAFLPSLRTSHGTIVFNTALMAHTVLPFNGGYAASKCALEGWADSLRREVQPFGIRVAMLEAGYIQSELETKHRPLSESPHTPRLYPLEVALAAAMSASATKMANRPSASPRRMAEAMYAAAQQSAPRPRRIVGAGSRAIWALGCLPDRVQDRAFRAILPRLT